MSNKIPHRERVLYTLPVDVVRNVEKYSQKVRNGNKSGFVTDAITAYINLLRKKVESKRLRDSYAMAVYDGANIAQEWQVADVELEQALDDIEK